MSESRTALVAMRFWVEKPGTPSHYEDVWLDVSFPADFALHYDASQHCLTIRKPSGDVAAVYHGIRLMVTPEITSMRAEPPDSLLNVALPQY